MWAYLGMGDCGVFGLYSSCGFMPGEFLDIVGGLSLDLSLVGMGPNP
jgi:hypothetical protein